MECPNCEWEIEVPLEKDFEYFPTYTQEMFKCPECEVMLEVEFSADFDGEDWKDDSCLVVVK
jgi:hypothetical protein